MNDFENVDDGDKLAYDKAKVSSGKHTDKHKKNKSTDTMLDVCKKVIEKINIKSMILLFVLFLIVCSDIFVNFVISKIKGTTDINGITTKGLFIQATIITIVFTGLNLLISGGVI